MIVLRALFYGASPYICLAQQRNPIEFLRILDPNGFWYLVVDSAATSRPIHNAKP